MRDFPWWRAAEVASFVVLVAVFVWFDYRTEKQWRERMEQERRSRFDEEPEDPWNTEVDAA